MEIIKIGAVIYKIKNRKTKEKSANRRADSLKTLTKLTNPQSNGLRIKDSTKIRNEKGDVTNDFTEMKRIIRAL